jgi:hypothetical protein
MGKKDKKHRKKVEARNNRLKNEKARLEKAKREFIMKLIEQEKQKGMFDNNPTIDPINKDVPSVDTTLEGPQL